ncbi:hypothetical protein MRX96_004861 [Rhipicephalus microplus]
MVWVQGGADHCDDLLLFALVGLRLVQARPGESQRPESGFGWRCASASCTASLARRCLFLPPIVIHCRAAAPFATSRRHRCLVARRGPLGGGIGRRGARR